VCSAKIPSESEILLRTTDLPFRVIAVVRKNLIRNRIYLRNKALTDSSHFMISTWAGGGVFVRGWRRVLVGDRNMRNHRSLQFAESASATVGTTLLELILATGILMILASAVVPLARFTVKRQREVELHRALREMRNAIDHYKDAADRGLIRVEAGTEGYPPDLDTLVNGVDMGSTNIGGAGAFGNPNNAASSFGVNPAPSGGNAAGGGFASQPTIHVRFLRRIPVDPFTGTADWNSQSVTDEPTSTSWGGKDVFDVHSKSRGTALDGTKYADW
jgi:general secretion pathway protein G